jgi:hypothetical protein
MKNSGMAASDGEDDAPRQAEVAADVQRIDAGQQCAEAFVG